MISLNYFFRKNGSGEIIAKVLTCSVIQHYLPDLVSIIKIIHICHKNFNCYWVNAEEALEYTVGS